MAGNTEAMAKLFFAFCNLLASILRNSSEGGVLSENGSGVYSSSVLRVFQTLYYMLNTVEFSTIVQFTKKSASLNENEAMDMLSKCVSQMLNYLGTEDTLDVSSGIIKTLGMIATGLMATPGTSMLYPLETVEALVSGKHGHLSPDMRRLLSTITKQSVWEPRPIEASRARPVQIIFDDEDMLADLSNFDLSDIDDAMEHEPIPVDPEPISVPVQPGNRRYIVNTYAETAEAFTGCYGRVCKG
ncbi:hypothetical protein DL89DRAFT_129395 [Linderina pennispora]|uniref:Uncharacterized protein n=1 Tax=Linderina pennispora TaxID=61395 RepID=A0A1Y1WDI5_9FUNG|nr:uncharacterized protein DL89DRAFT_129395 [Linderina pennispora]ORX71597.1 hypothetical protein DL89DRAFT_129395 [Linderina pennispora]